MKHKKIGIWGLGVVGKSAIRFFKDLDTKNLDAGERVCIQVFDNRTLTPEEQGFLTTNAISIASDLEQFLEYNDTIIPSPGIKLENVYKKYEHKWLFEFDIFAQYFKKPIIAITGSVGKTSVTKLLSDILIQSEKNFLMGGNIGIACLDLIKEQEHAQGAVLEASSFQLAYTRAFAPDLAILTNIHPNHLDWHGTQEHYFESKVHIFLHQTETQKALMPLALKIPLKKRLQEKQIKSQLFYFHETKPTDQELSDLSAHETLFYINITDINTGDTNICIDKQIKKYNNGKHETLINLASLPSITFDQNWLIICSALHLMGIDMAQVPLYAERSAIPEHRLEKCASINTIAIYNDSKATTPASTLAAITQLQKKPIMLILGGLSKGVDRAPFVGSLKNKVKKIYCFGAEAEQLAAFCAQYAIPAEKLDSLESVVKTTIAHAQPGDQILFSPSGSSYDLFKDYEQRGHAFKNLVQQAVCELSPK